MRQNTNENCDVKGLGFRKRPGEWQRKRHTETLSGRSNWA